MSDFRVGHKIRAARVADAIFSLGWRPLKDPESPAKGFIISRKDSMMQTCQLVDMLYEEIMDVAENARLAMQAREEHKS